MNGFVFGTEIDDGAGEVVGQAGVVVTVPDGKSRRCVMDVVVAEEDAGRAFGTAFEACRGVEGFEITARRFEG